MIDSKLFCFCSATITAIYRINSNRTGIIPGITICTVWNSILKTLLQYGAIVANLNIRSLLPTIIVLGTGIHNYNIGRAQVSQPSGIQYRIAILVPSPCTCHICSIIHNAVSLLRIKISIKYISWSCRSGNNRHWGIVYCPYRWGSAASIMIKSYCICICFPLCIQCIVIYSIPIWYNPY
jgi:hypothetical protein